MKPTPAPGPPKCCLCRDGTYATVSLTISESEDCPRTYYCDPCSQATLSVIRDVHHRFAPVEHLPTPPPQAAPVVVVAPVKTPPPVVTAPPKRLSIMASVRAVEAATDDGYDLLALLGMKKNDPPRSPPR